MEKTINKKAQSTVEYIILVAALIGIVLVFMNPSGGMMHNAINSSIGINLNSMVQMSNRIYN